MFGQKVPLRHPMMARLLFTLADIKIAHGSESYGGSLRLRGYSLTQVRRGAFT